MNRKILIETLQGKQYEIRAERSFLGTGMKYRVWQVLGGNEAKLVSPTACFNTADLVDMLAHLGIFSGEDVLTLAEIRNNIVQIRASLNDYLTDHADY